MGDAAREHAEAFQFLALTQRLFGLHPRRDVNHHAAKPFDPVGCANRSDDFAHPENLARGVDQAVLDGLGLAGPPRRLGVFAGAGAVVGMHVFVPERRLGHPAARVDA